MVFTTKLRPSEIRFIQNSINSVFRDGGAVNDAISKMRNGDLRPEEFPSMNVFQLNGKYYSFDNRRLYVFRVAEYEGYISEVPVKIVPKGKIRPERFTTNNDGISVFVRQQVPIHKHYKESWFTKPDDRGNINIPAMHLSVTLYSKSEISYPAPCPAVESYPSLISSLHPDPILLPKQSHITPTAPRQTYQPPLPISLPTQSHPTPTTPYPPISDTDTDFIGVPTIQQQTYPIPEPTILPGQSIPTPTPPIQTYQMAKPDSTPEPSYLKPKISAIKKPANGIENPNFEQISDNSDTDYIAVPPRRPYSATPYYTPSSNNSVNNSYTSVKSLTNNSTLVSIKRIENTNTDTDFIGVPTIQRQTYPIPEPNILPGQSNPTPTPPIQTYQMTKPDSTLEPSYLKPKIGDIKKPANGIENLNFEQISENSDTDYIAVPPRRPHSATSYYTPSSNNSVNNSYTSVQSSTNNSIINHTTVQQLGTIPDDEPDKKPGLFRRFLNCCCCCSC